MQNLHETPAHNPSTIGSSPSGSNHSVSGYGPHLPDQSPSSEVGSEQKDENLSPSCVCGMSKVLDYATNYKQEPDFPHSQLVSLEEKINNPRWVIPVLPDQELEILLDAAIQLCRAGMYDSHSLFVKKIF